MDKERVQCKWCGKTFYKENEFTPFNFWGIVSGPYCSQRCFARAKEVHDKKMVLVKEKTTQIKQEMKEYGGFVPWLKSGQSKYAIIGRIALRVLFISIIIHLCAHLVAWIFGK